MFGRVLVLRRIAAADVAAFQAQAQVDPTVARLQAFLAAASMRRDLPDLIEMRTGFHIISSFNGPMILIVPVMHPKMFVVRHRIEQSQNMLARTPVEAIRENRVGRPRAFRQFQFWIIQNDFAAILDSELGADLQWNLCFFLTAVHSPFLLL